LLDGEAYAFELVEMPTDSHCALTGATRGVAEFGSAIRVTVACVPTRVCRAE